jgi:hypothetical protein
MSSMTENATLKEEQPLKSMRIDSLAKQLEEGQIVQVEVGQCLELSHLLPQDFIAVTAAASAIEQWQFLTSVMRRYSLELEAQGSIHIEEFSLSARTWKMRPGDSGSFTLKARPSAMTLPLEKLVSFLIKLPQAHGFTLLPHQDLIIEGIPARALQNYFDLSQKKLELAAKEKDQDALFIQNCSILQEKNLALKIFGLGAKSVDRAIDMNKEAMMFRPIAKEVGEKAALVAVLISQGTTS